MKIITERSPKHRYPREGSNLELFAHENDATATHAMIAALSDMTSQKQKLRNLYRRNYKGPILHLYVCVMFSFFVKRNI